MRRFITVLVLAIFTLSLTAPIVEAKSTRGGHYAGGKGSSHKGGKYKNARTGDHYTKRR